MDGAGECPAKQNKLVRETKIPYDFSHMWNLKVKLNEKQTKKSPKQITHYTYFIGLKMHMYTNVQRYSIKCYECWECILIFFIKA